jgi:hypothetical protein
MVVGLLQSSADADYFTRLHIYVIDTSDDSIVGTLLNGYEESSGGGGTEWPFPAVGVALQSPQALSSVSVPNDSGDYRLVAEIGVRAENVHTTARLAGVRYGARTSNYAPLNDLTVGASTSALAGFLEFSFDIELADDVVPNVTIETAVAIPTAGAPITQTGLYDGGTTYEAWYQYTALTGQVFISVWAFGDLTTYKPLLQVYRAAGVVHVLGVAETDNYRRNKPLEIVTVPGTTYYFRVSPNTGNPAPSTLTIEVALPPTTTAVAGSLLIPDDTFGYPAVLLDATTGEVLRFVTPFASSEAGAILPNGISCFVDDDEVTTSIATVKLYDPSLNLITSLDLNVRGQGPVTTNGLDRFYIENIGPGGSGLDQGSIHVVTSDGAYLGKVADVGVVSPRGVMGMAVSPDETILYYSRYHLNDGFEADAIHRWNLTTDTAMSTLVGVVSDHRICREILCLPDGTILASYNHFEDPGSFVRHYSEAGATLHTYPGLEPTHISDEIRLAHDPDGVSFWVWTKTDTSTSISTFRHILIDDGSDLITPIEVPFFNTGLFGPPETETPEMFGHSFSCPFIVMRGAVTGSESTTGAIIGPLVWVHMTRRT